MSASVVALALRTSSSIGAPAEDRLLERRRTRAEHARSSKSETQSTLAADSPCTVSSDKLQVALACIPGVSDVLQLRRKRGTAESRATAAIRMALSPPLRGSGAAIERCRHLQHAGQALLAEFSVAKQDQALEIWKNHSDSALIRGLTVKWDEAAQWLRGLFDSSSGASVSKQQKLLHVLVAQPALFQCRAAEIGDGATYCVESQPWLCGPAFLRSVKHGEVLEGLRRCLPLRLDDPMAYKDFLIGAVMGIILLAFDSGSSCLVVHRIAAAAVEAADDDKTMIHGEKCSTHSFHKVKVRCITRTRLDAVLFSIGKIVQHTRSVQSFCDCIIEKVSKSFEVRYYSGDKPPPDPELMAIIKYILSIDGDDSLVTNEKSCSFWQRVRRILEDCPFDRATGRWVMWRHESQRLVDFDLIAMTKVYAKPIVDAFAFTRWEDGAISRWNGVMQNLKRIVIGIVCNNVLLNSLSALAGNMQLTEKKVGDMLEQLKIQRNRGEEVDDKWARHCSRIVRVSVVLREPARQWQVGVALLSSLIADELHWDVLGNSTKLIPQATLTRMVDPNETIVGKALQRIVREMDDFREASNVWGVLRWLRGSLEDKDLVRHCQAVYAQLSAGIFLRGDLRLATAFYMGQCLISRNMDNDEVAATLKYIYGLNACCVGSFMRKFRRRFPTPAQATAKLCGPPVYHCIDTHLSFTTASVECEHKQMKEELRSSTTGKCRGVAGRRVICRRLNAAHVARGGADVSLPLSKKRKCIVARLGTSSPVAKKLPRICDAPHLLGIGDGKSLALPGIDIDPNTLLQWSKVKSANMLFMNYKRALNKRMSGVIKKEQALKLDKVNRDSWTSSHDLRARWEILFRSVKALAADPRRLRVKSLEDGASAPPAKNRKVWQNTFHDVDVGVEEAKSMAMVHAKQADVIDLGPVSPKVFAKWQEHTEKSVTQLTKSILKNTSSFDVTEVPVPKAQHSSARHVWGCSSMPQNVCRRELADQKILRPFVVNNMALREYVKGMGVSASQATEYIMLTAQVRLGLTVSTVLGLHELFKSPQFQVYTRCKVFGRECDDDGFFKRPPSAMAVPLTVEMMVHACRLCRFSKEPKFFSLHHETSDEVVARLVRKTTNFWSVQRLNVEPVVGCGTLRQLRVLSFEPKVRLRERPGSKIPAADAFYAFLSMRERHTAKHSDVDDEHAELPHMLEDAGPADSGVIEEELAFGEGDAAAELDADDLIDIDSIIGDPGCEDLDGDDTGGVTSEADSHAEESDVGDEVALGMAVGDLEAPDADLHTIEVLETLAEASLEDGFDTLPVPSDTTVASIASRRRSVAMECEDFSVSLLGYVRCPRLKPEGTIGHIGWFGKYENQLFATCHLHARCRIQCGTVMIKRTPADIAAWLVAGKVVATADMSERVREGELHMAHWNRM